MDSPKKKTLNPNPLSLEESLTDDVIITILAKISRFYYPLLSLVSKRFRSLIYSKDLFMIRSSLGTTQNTLFVSLKSPNNQEHLSWYNLWKNPNQSKYLLVPTTNFLHNSILSTPIAVNDSICYTIDHGYDEFSCTVQQFCRKKTCPDMKVARKNAVVYPFGQKIYVMGGCNDSETTNWGEVFDIKTQTWESFMCPDVLRRYKIYKIKSLKSKFYVWTDTKDYVYNINEDKWEVLEERLSRSKTWCVVNGEMYRHDNDYGLRWFNGKIKSWIPIYGLGRLNILSENKRMIEIIEYDGKLLMFWDKISNDLNRNKNICCVEIELQDRYGVMCGKIQWIGIVLTVPSSYDFVNWLSKPV